MPLPQDLRTHIENARADAEREITRLAAEHAELRALVERIATLPSYPIGQLDREMFAAVGAAAAALLARLDGAQ